MVEEVNRHWEAKEKAECTRAENRRKAAREEAFREEERKTKDLKLGEARKSAELRMRVDKEERQKREIETDRQARLWEGEVSLFYLFYCDLFNGN